MQDFRYKLSNDYYNDDVFNINSKYGFLPIKDPLVKLPFEYNFLQNILDNMPVVLNENQNGYLFYPGKLQIIVKELPNYLEDIKKVKDKFLIQALYRAYTFLSSAYLLEPAYQHYINTGEYGKAEKILPVNISQPLFYVANILEVAPYQDYHYSYSLCNYKRKDPKGPLSWDNLEMTVKYSGTTDEAGFIMVHVDINSLSPNLINSIYEVVSGIYEFNKEKVLIGLKLNYETTFMMNKRRKEMWKASDWRNYNKFRIFIMGSEGNSDIFGDGVIYEGTLDETPKVYRGQTGAQDDIIPTQDIFTGLIKYYPDNILTRYLIDLRKYRPKVVQEFFKDLESDKKIQNIIDFISELCGKDGLTYLLMIVNEIYNFRNGHWQFVQKYIMSNTKYNIATGGTPITTWIPNQLEATLTYMQDIIIKIINHPDKDFLLKNEFNELLNNQKMKCDFLKLQIQELNEANMFLMTPLDFNRLNGVLSESKN